MDSLMIAPGPVSPPSAIRHEADSRTVYLQRPESVPLSLGSPWSDRQWQCQVTLTRRLVLSSDRH